MSGQKRALIYGCFVVVMWSTVATAFKIALNSMTPALLLLIASIITLFISFFAILIQRDKRSFENFFDRKRILKNALLGLINPFVYYLILFKAYSLLPAQIAQPLNFSWQVILVIMLVFVMKQRLTFRTAMGIVISFVGVIIISTNDTAAIEGELSLLGIILVIVSTFLWASYWILNLKSEEDSTVALFKNFLFGTIYLTIYLLIFPQELFLISLEGTIIHPEVSSILAAIYSGICEMGITFILWGKALKLADNKFILTQMTYLAPVISLIFISIILGESITILTVVGLLLIIAGLLVSNRRTKSEGE